MKYFEKAFVLTHYSTKPGEEFSFRRRIQKEIFGKTIGDASENDESVRNRLIKNIISKNVSANQKDDLGQIYKGNLESHYENMFLPRCYIVWGSYDILAMTLADDLILGDEQTCQPGASVHRSIIGLIPKVKVNEDFFKSNIRQIQEGNSEKKTSKDIFFSLEKDDLQLHAKNFPFIGVIQLQFSHLFPSSENFVDLKNNIKEVKSVKEIIIENIEQVIFKQIIASQGAKSGQKWIENVKDKFKLLVLDCLGWQDLAVVVFAQSNKTIFDITRAFRSSTINNLLQITCQQNFQEFLANREFKSYAERFTNNNDTLEKLGHSHAFMCSVVSLGFDEALDCKTWCVNFKSTKRCLKNGNIEKSMPAYDHASCGETISQILELMPKEKEYSAEIKMYCSFQAKPGHCSYVKEVLMVSFKQQKLSCQGFASLTAGNVSVYLDLPEKRIPAMMQAYNRASCKMLINCEGDKKSSDLLTSNTHFSLMLKNDMDMNYRNIEHNKDILLKNWVGDEHAYHHAMVTKIFDTFKEKWWPRIGSNLRKLRLSKVVKDSVHNCLFEYFNLLSDPEMTADLIDLYPTVSKFIHNLCNIELAHAEKDNLFAAISDWINLMNKAISSYYHNSVRAQYSTNILSTELKLDVTKYLETINSISNAIFEIAGENKDHYATVVTLVTSKPLMKEFQIRDSHFLMLNTHFVFEPETNLPVIFHELFHIILHQSTWMKKISNEILTLNEIVKEISGAKSEGSLVILNTYSQIIEDIICDFFLCLFIFGEDENGKHDIIKSVERGISYLLSYFESNDNTMYNEFWDNKASNYLVRFSILITFAKFVSRDYATDESTHKSETPREKHKFYPLFSRPSYDNISQEEFYGNRSRAANQWAGFYSDLNGMHLVDARYWRENMTVRNNMEMICDEAISKFSQAKENTGAHPETLDEPVIIDEIRETIKARLETLIAKEEATLTKWKERKKENKKKDWYNTFKVEMIIKNLIDENEKYAPKIVAKWLQSDDLKEKAKSLVKKIIVECDIEVCRTIENTFGENTSEKPGQNQEPCRDELQEKIKSVFGETRSGSGMSTILKAMFIIYDRWLEYTREGEKLKNSVSADEKTSGYGKSYKEDFYSNLKDGVTVPFLPKEGIKYQGIRHVSTLLRDIWRFTTNDENLGKEMFFKRDDTTNAIAFDAGVGKYALDHTGGGYSLNHDFRGKLLAARAALIGSISGFSNSYKAKCFELLIEELILQLPEGEVRQ